ncbi:MAG: type I-E CRISPR-associated protein Cas5/CasD [Dehalococcoidia bacterium]
MAILLIRLCGPMQSWGTRSRWSERDTELEPTLSGVTGLICAAMGHQRDLDLPPALLDSGYDLGVRVLREGTPANDYHTAGGGYPKGQGVARADGGRLDNAVLSNRQYLADADFLCGLVHPDGGFLGEVEAALKAPVWQLYLGRKAFVPSVPIWLGKARPGLREGGRDELKAILSGEDPPPIPGDERRRERRLGRGHERFVLPASSETSSESRWDRPQADSFRSRRFRVRYVRTSFEPSKEASHA